MMFRVYLHGLALCIIVGTCAVALAGLIDPPDVVAGMMGVGGGTLGLILGYSLGLYREERKL